MQRDPSASLNLQADEEFITALELECHPSEILRGASKRIHTNVQEWGRIIKSEGSNEKKQTLEEGLIITTLSKSYFRLYDSGMLEEESINADVVQGVNGDILSQPSWVEYYVQGRMILDETLGHNGILYHQKDVYNYGKKDKSVCTEFLLDGLPEMDNLNADGDVFFIDPELGSCNLTATIDRRLGDVNIEFRDEDGTAHITVWIGKCKCKGRIIKQSTERINRWPVHGS